MECIGLSDSNLRKEKIILRQFVAFSIILIIKLSPDEGTMQRSVTVN